LRSISRGKILREDIESFASFAIKIFNRTQRLP
jgi:hypothetical protein